MTALPDRRLNQLLAADRVIVISVRAESKHSVSAGFPAGIILERPVRAVGQRNKGGCHHQRYGAAKVCRR